jgi:regulator of protease activity HflC (stomatin/prohibitin superfamily)
MKRPPLKKLIRTLLLVIFVPLFAFLFYMSRLDWVPAGHVGVIYDASKGLLPEVYNPRAIYIGWRQQLYTYPTRLNAAIYTEDETAGESKTADGILITTNDNANTLFDVVVIYRIKKEDVMNVFNSFGAVPIDEIQRNFIRRAVKEAANDVGTQYDLFSLMGSQRADASLKLTKLLQSKLIAKGISVETAMLGGCYPSQDIQQKIASRVNSYVELEISRLKRQIAEIDRQVAIVKGEANSTAAVMTASEAKDRSIELLKLETAEAAIEKWDGALPPVSPKAGQTIVLTQDLLRQLGGQQ